ncbi:MAG: nucleotidyltransferase domain-containing protein [Acidilobus sp.]
MRYGHGSVVTLRSGLIGVEIGLPSQPGYLPIIPKYFVCQEGPWSKGLIKFCRIIQSYGPTGVASSFSRSGLRLIYDPLYGALMPYVSVDGVLDYRSPYETLLGRVLSGDGRLSHVVIKATDLMANLSDGLESLGLTGSFAMGTEEEFSDVDFIVYGEEAAEKAYEGFLARAGPVECKEEFGGLRINGWRCLPWRRGVIEGLGRPVSWVGVPLMGPGAHCGPLIKGPGLYGLRPFEGKLTVPGSQPTALLYPPCVKTEEGYTLMSYEYNAGGPLYEGGEVKVLGLMAERLKVVIIGSREVPGSLRLLRPYGG